MSDETTQPPVRQPNTPRTWLRRAWAWVQMQWRDNPDRVLMFGIGVLAFVAGALIF